MRGPPWEHGSDPPLSLDVGRSAYPWSARPHSLWGSGREALRAVVRWGVDRHGWGRLLVPSYYCQDVLPAAADEIDLAVYPRGPLERDPSPLAVNAGDVVMGVSVFGRPIALDVDGRTPIVEDHSHDPWSPLAARSRAPYAFASLRKALPLPDGGVVWSPLGLPVPGEIATTPTHDAAVHLRLQAMALKLAYLRGADVSKATFRSLYVAGEAALRSAGPSGISAYSRATLAHLPITRWRRVRARNLRAFREAIGEPAGVALLDASFAVVLVLDSQERREGLRRALIDASIYPAVLWPLEEPVVAGIPAADVDLSRRLLVLHADQRYSPSDMRRVADVVRDTLDRP